MDKMKKFTKKHRENLSKAAFIAQNRPEQKAKISSAKKGKNNPQWGKKWDDKRRLWLSKRMKKYPIKYWLGKKQPKDMIKKRIKSRKWYKPSLITIDKMSKARRGARRWNWKGGITPLTKQIRRCLQYRQWRSNVYQRDNWTCQTCQKRGGTLVAHHIKKFYSIIQENTIKTLKKALKCKELWDISNGVTLCQDCHELTKKGKKYD